ncbi:hypothetical protein F4777DRAFT_591896 [Nemania sp. FL0916]|nr:hypothetical protein F4777DRAFT_591896 [Nemania sp. FL0916]
MQASTENETWVRVCRRKGRGRTTITPITLATPTPSAPTLTLEQVKENHDRFSAKWKATAAYIQLLQIVSDQFKSGNYATVTRAVCFGLGPFDALPLGNRDRARTAHFELVAFLTIVEHLESLTNSRIRCSFQDPVFNSVDKAFLESLGHQVVETPVGFELVDNETFAFGIHLYRDIYSQVFAAHIPAMFIGTSYELWEELHGENLNWARMKELDESCDKVGFPTTKGDRIYHIFFNSVIHWRRKYES